MAREATGCSSVRYSGPSKLVETGSFCLIAGLYTTYLPVKIDPKL
jgi:hypothetical protein